MGRLRGLVVRALVANPEVADSIPAMDGGFLLGTFVLSQFHPATQKKVLPLSLWRRGDKDGEEECCPRRVVKPRPGNYVSP